MLCDVLLGNVLQGCEFPLQVITVITVILTWLEHSFSLHAYANLVVARTVLGQDCIFCIVLYFLVTQVP